MADDNADWLSGDVEPEPEAPKSAFKKAKPAEEAKPAKEAEAPKPADAPEPELEGGEEDDYLDPDKLLLFKHWIRPKFLPYKIITEYRHNYYDDVIDYLDKRNRGIPREIPVPQTWPERILRTLTRQSNQNEIFRPRYLQYKYIYDYRKNYYDDVMEVVNSRRKGYKRNIPRPQTWAERVLRTYKDPIHKMETFDRFLEDIKLVTRSEVSGRIYKSQSMSNFNRRYTTKIDF